MVKIYMYQMYEEIFIGTIFPGENLPVKFKFIATNDLGDEWMDARYTLERSMVSLLSVL